MAQGSAILLADRAEEASRALPPLLVEAQRIAATVIMGVHGRKRAGPGESFWQYRPYSYGDSTSRIDWHKSARSDRVYIRENEWEAANTLWLWPSPSASMDFRSHLARTSKRERADLVALALATLAVRAHERVGLIGAPLTPGHSRSALLRLAEWIGHHRGAPLPQAERLKRLSAAVLIGDFFEPIEEVQAAFSRIAQAGVAGHVVQVVDPAEETLPYAGRVEFLEMAGPLKFLASKAESLREAYQAKFAAHREALRALAMRLGWSFTLHRTDQSATRLLMALHGLIGGPRSRAFTTWGAAR